jgi:hypothetical protein
MGATCEYASRDCDTGFSTPCMAAVSLSPKASVRYGRVIANRAYWSRCSGSGCIRGWELAVIIKAAGRWCKAAKLGWIETSTSPAYPSGAITATSLYSSRTPCASPIKKLESPSPNAVILMVLSSATRMLFCRMDLCHFKLHLGGKCNHTQRKFTFVTTKPCNRRVSCYNIFIRG